MSFCTICGAGFKFTGEHLATCAAAPDKRAEPFRDVADNHVPFRLERRIRRARRWWHWVLAGFSLTLCVYSALVVMQ